MLSYNDVSAWIEVDGSELEQYGVEQDRDQNQVTCWIATQPDKGFSVVFRDDATFRECSLSSSLQLDGSHITGKVLRPSLGFGHNYFFPGRKVVQNDHTMTATTSRPFIFSKVELTDDDEYLNKCSAHLGEIRISIYRCQSLEPSLYQFGPDVAGHGKVHERAKKAVTHCVSYGQEVNTAPQYGCPVRYLDGRTPIATFVFRYRDHGLLRANGIIPKPPPAKREPIVFNEVLDLTKDDGVKPEPFGEGIEIVGSSTPRRTARLPRKRLNPNRESETQSSKRVKRENKAIQIGEVIDLT